MKVALTAHLLPPVLTSGWALPSPSCPPYQRRCGTTATAPIEARAATYNTQLVEKGGCAIWYNEPQVRNTRCKSEKWLWHDGYVNHITNSDIASYVPSARYD